MQADEVIIVESLVSAREIMAGRFPPMISATALI
jgi:hypothetical protein